MSGRGVLLQAAGTEQSGSWERGSWPGAGSGSQRTEPRHQAQKARGRTGWWESCYGALGPGAALDALPVQADKLYGKALGSGDARWQFMFSD